MSDSHKARNIGVVCCDDAPKWGGEEGCFNLIENIFDCVDAGGLEDSIFPRINWIPIYAISGNLPDESELKDYDGFIMSGSHYSVNDDQAWIIRLQEWIKKVVIFQENNIDSPSVVGICFSHQLVNKALGGTVGPNLSKRFVWKAEDIKMDKSAKDHRFFKDSFYDGRSNFRLLQSHGESVLSLPGKAKRLASSSSCENEIVAINDRILTLQSHPEMPVAPMIDLILPSLKSKQLISDFEAESGLQSFKTERDDDLMMKLIKRFLIRK